MFSRYFEVAELIFGIKFDLNVHLKGQILKIKT